MMRYELTLGAKIRHAREYNNIKQVVFARMLEVSEVTMGRWENNLTEPKAGQLKQISEITGFDINYFYGIESVKKYKYHNS